MAILPPDDAPLPPSPGRPGGWGEKLEQSLVRFLTDLLNRTKALVAGVFRYAFELFLESIEPNLIEMTAPLFRLLDETEELPEEVRELLADVRTGQRQVGSLLLSSIGSQAVGAVTGNVLGTLLAKTTHRLNRRIQPVRLDFATLYRARNRDGLPFGMMTDDLADQGWSAERIGAADTAAQTRPGVSELITLWLRGEIAEPTFRARLIEEGVPPAYHQDVIALARAIPGPSDLVRFALREAWDDSVAAKYGYDAGFSEQFADWLEKQGFAREWATRYWRAHWDLPSVTAGFEMLHRDIIDRQTLDELLTISDIPQYWRERLIRISYRPYTRVDVRRMYQFGILTEEDVLRAYKDIGYDDEHAANLTAFAIADATESDRELTKSDILSGYALGMLDLATATAMLVDIGYTENGAAFLLGREEFKRAQKLVDLEVSLIEDLYTQGDIALTEAHNRLSGLGLPARQIELYLEEWRIRRAANAKRPTRATLERFFRQGIIDLDQFIDQMQRIGYQDQFLNWYTESMALQRQEEQESQERKARDEQEALRKRREKSAYALARAQIDVDIAEIKTAISATDVAIMDLVTERDRQLEQALSSTQVADLEDEFLPLIHEAQAAIDAGKVYVAELRAEITARQNRIAQIDQSLVENIDLARRAVLQADRRALQTAIRQQEELIAADETSIRVLKELIPTLTEEADITEAKQTILELETEIATYKEVIADLRTQQAQIDEAMLEIMDVARRQELERERAAIETEVSGLDTTIRGVQVQIAEATEARGNAQRALQAAIAALPGAIEAARIRAEFATAIDAQKAHIKRLKANVSELLQQKALLTVGYREAQAV